MGIHESQSLFFEMQLARHSAFIGKLAPRIRATFGEQSAFEPANLARLYTRSTPKPYPRRCRRGDLSHPYHAALRD